MSPRHAIKSLVDMKNIKSYFEGWKCESDRRNMSPRYAIKSHGNIESHVDVNNIKSHYEAWKYERDRRDMSPSDYNKSHVDMKNFKSYLEGWKYERQNRKMSLRDASVSTNGNMEVFAYESATSAGPRMLVTPAESKGLTNMWICVSELLFSLQKMK